MTLLSAVDRGLVDDGAVCRDRGLVVKPLHKLRNIASISDVVVLFSDVVVLFSDVVVLYDSSPFIKSITSCFTIVRQQT